MENNLANPFQARYNVVLLLRIEMVKTEVINANLHLPVRKLWCAV